MTPEEINYAIADHLGIPTKPTTRWGFMDERFKWQGDFESEQEALSSHHGGSAPQRYTKEIPPPNYHGDLNAMAEAEKSLSDDERWEQIKILTGWKPAPSGFPLIGRFEAAALLTATAAHRAETFLRTVGKWKEPTP